MTAALGRSRNCAADVPAEVSHCCTGCSCPCHDVPSRGGRWMRMPENFREAVAAFRQPPAKPDEPDEPEQTEVPL